MIALESARPDVPWRLLAWSTRTFNLLVNVSDGCPEEETLRALAARTMRRELRRARGIGPVTLREIDAAMAAAGIKFGCSRHATTAARVVSAILRDMATRPSLATMWERLRGAQRDSVLDTWTSIIESVLDADGGSDDGEA